jgi:hypothetical protein
MPPSRNAADVDVVGVVRRLTTDTQFLTRSF